MKSLERKRNKKETKKLPKPKTNSQRFGQAPTGREYRNRISFGRKPMFFLFLCWETKRVFLLQNSTNKKKKSKATRSGFGSVSLFGHVASRALTVHHLAVNVLVSDLLFVRLKLAKQKQNPTPQDFIFIAPRKYPIHLFHFSLHLQAHAAAAAPPCNPIGQWPLV